MSLSALAWGPGHPSIVTYDEAELLAYDSETEAPKWRLTLDRPIAGVALGDASALDVPGSTPFRTPAAIGAVLAVDADGRLHAVDASSGHRLGDVGPFGVPRSLVTAPVGGGIAIAVAGKVVVWRKGARSEMMLEASAVAFSNDGATLAVATEQGVVKMFDLTGLDGQDGPRETASFDARGPVADLVQHPSGAWVVAGSRATLRIDPSGIEALEKIPVGAKRMRFDAGGGRVAVQLSQRQVLVYAWPALGVLARIEYTERPVRGIAFGDRDWLGVAMDHGDGNKIDVATGAVNRTDTHPGRQHRSWTLYVETTKKQTQPGLSASDEDAIRRMRTPAPADPGGFGRGGRIGIITVISVLLLGLRVCVRLGSTSSSHSSSYSSSGYTPPPATTACGQACAIERLSRLVRDCQPAGCESDAQEAASAMTEGDCARAEAALARIPKGAPSSPLLHVDKLLADMGVREACASGSIAPKKKALHPKLVRLVGPLLTESSEPIPEKDGSRDGERPRDAWTAPDGTLFVLGVTGGAPNAVLHRRSPAGAWEIVHDEYLEDSEKGLSLFGFAADDVYATFDKKLFHFDGKKLEPVKGPRGLRDEVTFITGTKQDLFAVVNAHVFRRRGGEWTEEKSGERVVGSTMRGGGASVWALGFDDEGAHVPIARAPDGTWGEKKVGADAGELAIQSLWVSPSGDPFLFAEDSVLRGSAGGARWVTDPLVLAGSTKDVWGRSSTDVYLATAGGIMHFDGKTWTRTPQSGRGVVLTGTSKEVFLVRADE